MTVALTDPIVAPSRITAAQVRAWYVDTFDRPVPTADSYYVEEVMRLCSGTGVDALVVIAQWSVETDTGQSVRWRTNHNPAGLSVESDTDPDPAKLTATQAAELHIWALLTATGVEVGSPLSVLVDDTVKPGAVKFLNRWRGKVADPGYPRPVRTVADLCRHYVDASGEPQATWAWDTTYAAQLVARANDLLRSIKEAPVPTVYQIVGLPGPGIELPVPLAHRILPATQTNQRPGISRQTPGYWVQHETDNHAAGADAMMHATYLENGAEGRQASWHFTVDDGIIVQHLPIDEVGWHAADGGGPGNMSGIACELCVNAGIDTAKARHNAEALAGGICKALGLPSDRVRRHWDFNAATVDRHHCPDTMMNDGYWPTFVSNVGAFVTPEPPLPTYATPEVPDWFAHSVTQDAPSDAIVDGVRWWVMRRNVEALKRVQRYSRPDTRSPKSGDVITPRTRVRIERTFDLKDERTGKMRQWHVGTDGSYLTAASFTPRVVIRSR